MLAKISGKCTKRKNKERERESKRASGQKIIIKPSASAAAKIVDPSQFTYRIYNQTHMCVAFRFHIISSAIQIIYVLEKKQRAAQKQRQHQINPRNNDDDL